MQQIMINDKIKNGEFHRFNETIFSTDNIKCKYNDECLIGNISCSTTNSDLNESLQLNDQ